MLSQGSQLDLVGSCQVSFLFPLLILIVVFLAVFCNPSFQMHTQKRGAAQQPIGHRAAILSEEIMIAQRVRNFLRTDVDIYAFSDMAKKVRQSLGIFRRSLAPEKHELAHSVEGRPPKNPKSLGQKVKIQWNPKIRK